MKNGNTRLTKDEMKSNALSFSRRHRDDVDEDSESQSFLNDFFDVFGFDRKLLATFEKRVPLGSGHTGFIDLLWKGRLLVEMKSRGKDLDKAYAQAKNYVMRLREDERPILIMVCDFARIRLYDMTRGVEADSYYEFEVQALARNLRHFSKILGFEDVVPDRGDDERVNIEAAEHMAKLHLSMRKMVFDSHELQIYLVRILFCLFSEDSGIFEKYSFENYIRSSREDGSDLAGKLSGLFDILNTPETSRPEHLPDELKGFPYVNGGLFKEQLHTAFLDAGVRTEILKCCSFDWDYISPAIFGAMFQGVMNPDERRELGAHYTSEGNILRVIKPLFLDALWAEFERAKGNTTALERFHERLASLKFLDPACGCGNFLIIAYRELRKLEFEVIKKLHEPKSKGMFFLDVGEFVRVNVDQFYGIEYEEFPSQIAQVGMWLVDHQWNTIIAEFFGYPFKRLPLKQSATIYHGNALRKDWEELVPREELSYIMGNPPFVGGRLMSKEQKDDMSFVFGNLKGIGNLDYVTAWYKKAALMMKDTQIQTAFVSSNSITQGEQPAILWRSLVEVGDVQINFGYRTFKWNNEAKGKAAVHCVIIGFDMMPLDNRLKRLFDEEGREKFVKNINAYLVDASDTLVESRRKPLCDVPDLVFGNMPNDGGNLIIEDSEYGEFIQHDPNSKKFIRPLLGAGEFINNKKRWCIWLKGVNPADIAKCPEIVKRVKKVQEFRQSSKREATRKLAQYPTLFGEIRNSQTSYLLIPRHSSESREYIPIGFISPDIISSDANMIIPNATLYHFGVLTSKIHMAWVKTVCGRLKSDYRYSASVVYNNFPFPEPTEAQKAEIEKYAQGVLDARGLFPDSSLADLYDPLTMPPELRKAHDKLDKAVEKAYGRKFENEAEIVAYLMERYKELTQD